MGDMTVAETIRDQIGVTAMRMINAQVLVGTENSLTFRIMPNEKGVTHIRVKLMSDDLYTCQALNIDFNAPIDRSLTVVEEWTGVYFDMLRGFIEDTTGLATVPPCDVIYL
jgi:hypothetical protein